MDKNEELKRIHAPYNFVPFSSTLIKRYEKIQELPPHDQIDPKLKTGEIYVRLEAEMPIYVSNGQNQGFFKGPDGNYQIPGSSIRGMLRENMQILGMGLVRLKEDLADYQIYFRDVASASNSLGKKVKEGYTKALAVETKRISKQDGKTGTVSIPKNVNAGFLCEENGEYYIQPSRFYRVSRNNPGMDSFKRDGKVIPTAYFDVAFTDDGDWVRNIVLKENAKNGMKRGVLLSTGRPVREKENALYVIEKNSEEDFLPISREDVNAYKEDLENRRNALKRTDKDTDFWELPKNSGRKAVFYITYNGHIYFGMSLFLRIGYPNKISDGLPKKYKEVLSESENGVFLDYPYSMMGFATKEQAYRSRISVGDFKATEKKECKESYYLIGGEPKPSYYAGYLRNGKSYMDDDFSLRGYKQYWMREEVYQPKELDNKDMGKRVRPLGKGTVFEGVIRYKNLHEDELGLLLWALKLDKGCYQSVGMGKPYGLGRVSVKITGMKELNPAWQYSLKSFTEKKELVTDCVDQYIEKYKNFASDMIAAQKDDKQSKSEKKPKNGERSKNKKSKIEEQSSIKTFMFIHKISKLSEEEMEYMKLKEYKNERVLQKELIDIMKEQEDDKKEPPKEKKIVGGLDFSNFSFKVR